MSNANLKFNSLKMTSNATEPTMVLGEMYYNSTTKKFYVKDTVLAFEVSAFPTQVGIFAGGYNGNYLRTTCYVSIVTTANATNFGNTSSCSFFMGGNVSSTTRGVFAGGYNAAGSIVSAIEYFILSTTGNVSSFGSLNGGTSVMNSGCSNSTRGIFHLGTNESAVLNTIDYITIATIGNSTDFGDLTVARISSTGCASTTRGVFIGGGTSVNPDFSIINVMDYITIASAGNATDFGDIVSFARNRMAACSSSTRGVFGGGYNGGAYNNIEYITIASTGNSTDFGDLTSTSYANAACSSTIRGIISLGGSSANYVTIASTGNATTFGNLTGNGSGLASCSNCHGGLS